MPHLALDQSTLAGECNVLFGLDFGHMLHSKREVKPQTKMSVGETEAAK